MLRKAEEKGIDVEDLALSKEDPQEGIKLRMELAEKYMAEALIRVMLSKPQKRLIRLQKRLLKP